MSKFKIVCVGFLSIASACSTTKNTAAAYTVRFLPVWNPVLEGIITICTQPNVLTIFIHSIFKPRPNFIIKNTVKIMDKDQNNNYNTQLSDIHLAPSLCWVKRHNIYIKKPKKWNVNSPILKVPLQISSGQFLKCLQYKTATSSTYTIKYPTSTLKKWVINMYVAYKNGFHMGEIISSVNKYS